jgi:hypothetical protein
VNRQLNLNKLLSVVGWGVEQRRKYGAADKEGNYFDIFITLAHSPPGAVVMYLAWLHDPRVDSLERKARALSGWRATGCGCSVYTDAFSKEVIAKRVAVNDCVAAAFKEKKAFRARYEDSAPGVYSTQQVVGRWVGKFIGFLRALIIPYRRVCSTLPCNRERNRRAMCC